MDIDYLPRVKRGIEYLDKHNPHWWRQIEVTELQMSSCRHCVLGQLYGDFTFRPDGFPDPVEFGFEIQPHLNTNGTIEYTKLRNIWRDEIENRQECD